MAVAFDKAAEAVRARLSDGAYEHCCRVANTAGQLASIYGVDPDSARLAGLLHDWDRELDGEELLAAASKAGLEVGAEERVVPYLLHARTGAAAATSALPGLPVEIGRAIERHTVGAADMSELDMIVYVADMIEPQRHFKGVDDLREAAGTISLPDLFALAYQHSLLHLVRARKRIHPTTVAVWNALVERDSR